MAGMVGGFWGLAYFAAVIILCGFAVGTFFALPMIWYHAGHISRKLDKVIDLLERRGK